MERRVSERLAEAGDFIRHIPRTVSAGETHFREISDDRARLQERLEDHGLCEHVVKGDGNCQVCDWPPLSAGAQSSFRIVGTYVCIIQM